MDKKDGRFSSNETERENGLKEYNKISSVVKYMRLIEEEKNKNTEDALNKAAECRNLKQEVDMHKQANAAIQKKYDETFKQLSAMEAEKTQREQQIRTEWEEKEIRESEFAAAIEKMAAEKKELENQLQKLSNEKTGLNSKLSNMTEKNQELCYDLEMLDKKNETLKRQNEEWKPRFGK